MPVTNEETIFAEALAKGSAEEQAAYLDHACAGDVQLRRDVQALLAAHLHAGGILEVPPSKLDATRQTPVLSEDLGSTIGPFKLLEQIGGGGMGVVYMAEQTHPVRRKVALKVIKAGMDTKQVIARFEAERQALTMMDHPNIAKVLDAGTTDAGRPYFVMELVKGIPITDYCDQARLTTRERLELFMQVCHAVQHAHQKGIIHRDLKPSNVLVTLHDDKPVPKVIDFGIAKAAGGVLTERTLFTNYAQMLGTPLYMSPEQAQISGLDVDTRSDVYSLGVLLYELLTGTTPFDKQRLREAAYDEMRRIIREEEPPNPSTRLSTMGEQVTVISAQRHTDPKKLGQLVRGELDWIVMKALEKERARRYETANGLANDVLRYLKDEAVQACPPSARYRFRKFARRNKGALVTMSLLVAGLSTLVVGLAVSNHMIAAERNQKAEALALAEAQSKRAQTNLWRANEAIRALISGTAMDNDHVPLAMRQRFSEEATKYYQALIQDSASDQNSRYETGVGYRKLGELHQSWKDVDSAEKCFQKAIAIFEVLAAEDPMTQTYRHQLGFVCYSYGLLLADAGRLEVGLAMLTRGRQICEKLLTEGPDEYDFASELATVLKNMGGLQTRMRKYQDARSSYSRALELLTRLVEGRSAPKPYPTDPSEHTRKSLWTRIGDITRQMAISLRGAQQYDEAETAFRQGIGIYERATELYPQSAYFLYFLADTHRLIALVEIDRKQPGKAEIELRRAVEIHQQCMDKFPEEMLSYPQRADCYRDINRLLVSAGREQEATSLIRDIKIPPKDLHLRIFRAGLLRDVSESQQAFADYSQVLTASPELAEAWSRRAFAHFDLQQWEPAIADFSRAIELDPEVHTNWWHRGHSYIALGQWDKAAADFTTVTEKWPLDSETWYLLGLTHAQLRRPDQALTDLRQAVAKGFKDAERMKADLNLQTLRDNHDFKELLSELDKKANPALTTRKSGS